MEPALLYGSRDREQGFQLGRHRCAAGVGADLLHQRHAPCQPIPEDAQPATKHPVIPLAGRPSGVGPEAEPFKSADGHHEFCGPLAFFRLAAYHQPAGMLRLIEVKNAGPR
jgi:hypothetical protein